MNDHSMSMLYPLINVTSVPGWLPNHHHHHPSWHL